MHFTPRAQLCTLKLFLATKFAWTTPCNYEILNYTDNFLGRKKVAINTNPEKNRKLE